MARRHALAAIKLKATLTRKDALELIALIEKLGEPESVAHCKEFYKSVIVAYDDDHGCDPDLFYIP